MRKYDRSFKERAVKLSYERQQDTFQASSALAEHPCRHFIEIIHIAKKHYIENLSESYNPNQTDIIKDVGTGRDIFAISI